MEHRARPFVCGILGPVEAAVVERLQRTVPGLVTVHERPDVVLLASRSLDRYDDGRTAGAWVFGDRPPRSGNEWRDAALEMEASGLADLEDTVVLHAGAHGMLDLFHRRVGGATCFASRLGPLLDLADEPLDVDWQDWASNFVLNFPAGDGTGFRQVRRLPGSTTLTLERRTGRVTQGRWSPPWLGLPPARADDGDPAPLLEALRSALAKYGDGPVSLPLSAGFDSRLLGILVRDAGWDAVTWTTDPDRGRDEITLGGRVAHALGLRNIAIPLVEPEYPGLADDSAERKELRMPLHLWATRMARQIREHGVRTLDGLGMDIVIGNTHIPDAAIEAPDAATRDDELFDELAYSSPHGRVVPTRTADWMRAAARERWDAACAHLVGDANELTLRVLSTRSIRGPGAMPVWLYGPEVPVMLPGMDPHVIVAALSVDPRAKAHDVFYRRLLEFADPAVAALPSTHDATDEPRGVVRLKSSPTARAWLLEHVRAARTVPGLASEGLDRILATGQVPPPAKLPPGGLTPLAEANRLAHVTERAVAIAVMGTWVERHRHRLRSLEPPWADLPERPGPEPREPGWRARVLRLAGRSRS